jgi:hypothetical protein
MAEKQQRKKVRFGGQSTASTTNVVGSGVVIQPAHGPSYLLVDANVCSRCSRARPNETLTVRGSERLCRECIAEEGITRNETRKNDDS